MGDVFSGVIGHAPVLGMLRSELARPAQAYLFVGPAGVGKATVARRFAAALLADDPSVRARVVAGNHPDLILVEPEGRASVTVDQARQAVAQASLAPMVADRKVFLFEEGGMMNEEAANALLKTLEEPTPSTIFVIVVDSGDELPPTVASRCRAVVFGRVPDDEVVAGLAATGLDREQAERSARVAGGRPGLALTMATRPEVAEFRRVWLSVPERLSGAPGDAYLLAEEVEQATRPLLAAVTEAGATSADELTGKRGEDRAERAVRRATGALHVSGLEILAGFYRDVAAAQLGAPVLNADIPATSLTTLSAVDAVAAAARVLDTIEALEANQRPVLAFANLFADLGAPH
ncbi:MAG: AAA family ATPase [Acidimicrobiia bacterium]